MVAPYIDPLKGTLFELLKPLYVNPNPEPERLPTYSKREYFRPLSFSIQRKAWWEVGGGRGLGIIYGALGLCFGLYGLKMSGSLLYV